MLEWLKVDADVYEMRVRSFVLLVIGPTLEGSYLTPHGLDGERDHLITLEARTVEDAQEEVIRRALVLLTRLLEYQVAVKTGLEERRRLLKSLLPPGD